MEFKVIISDGANTYQKEIKGEEAARLVGLRIGEDFDGALIGESKRLQVTGGTDKDGFPMRRGIPGARRVQALLRGGPGFNPQKSGARRKKRVRGDTVSEEIVQINTKVIEKEKKRKEVEAVKEPVKKEEIKPVKEPVKKEEVKPVKEPVKKEEEVKPVKEKVKKEEIKPVKEPVKKEEEIKPVKEPVKKEEEVKPVKEKVKKARPKPKPKPEPEEAEPIPVIKVKGVGKKTAELLHAAGITSASQLLIADLADLSERTGLSEKQIDNLKSSAEEVVGDSNS